MNTQKINWYTWQSSVDTGPEGSTTTWYFDAFTRRGSIRRAEAFFKEYNNGEA